VKVEQEESMCADEIQAEINRLENSRACLEARADRLEEEAKRLRNEAAITRDQKNRLNWLL